MCGAAFKGTCGGPAILAFVVGFLLALALWVVLGEPWRYLALSASLAVVSLSLLAPSPSFQVMSSARGDSTDVGLGAKILCFCFLRHTLSFNCSCILTAESMQVLPAHLLQIG